MAIILNDYQPSGDVVEIQFPGSKKRFEIPVADDVLTVEVLEQLAKGDNSVIIDLFDDEGKALVRKLHKTQFEQLVTAWTSSAKN